MRSPKSPRKSVPVTDAIKLFAYMFLVMQDTIFFTIRILSDGSMAEKNQSIHIVANTQSLIVFDDP